MVADNWSGSEVTSDAIPGVFLLLQCGGEITKIQTQWPAAKPVDHRYPRKVCLDHEPLLLLDG